MHLNANIALLIAGSPLGLGLPLLGGVLGTVSSLTGTHLAGSAVPIGSTSNGLTKAATTTATKTTTGSSNSAGALGPVLGLADPVLAPVAGAGGTVSGLLASVPAASKLNSNISRSMKILTGVCPAVEAKCDTKYQKCTVSVSGQIENMLTDGGNFSMLMTTA